MITMSITYERWNEDELDHGETYRCGFLVRDQEITLAKASDLLKEYPYPSGSEYYPGIWYSCSEMDADSGYTDDLVLSLHFSSDRPNKLRRLHQIWRSLH